MKVLLVTNNFTPHSGGVVSSLRVLVDALQKNNVTVKLVTLGFLDDHDDPAWVERIYCPIKFMYKTNHMAIAWRAHTQLANIFAAFKPDLIHVHHPFLLGAAALRIAKSARIPVVLTYHTMYETLYEAYAHYVPLPTKLVHWLIKQRIQRFCSMVDGIIAPSRYVAAHLQQQGINVPIQVIPSGLLPEYLAGGHIKQAHEGPLRLLSVGRMAPEKNLRFLLDLIKRLHDEAVPMQCTFIGYGSEYDALRTYAYHALSLPENIVMFIHKPEKTVIAQAYAQADLFLFASTRDTQALVLAEAMAAGTPVITLDGPGQQDIIKQGENGYILQNIDEMVAIIKELYGCPARLKRLSEGALVTAERYYPEEMVKQIVYCYNRHASNTST